MKIQIEVSGEHVIEKIIKFLEDETDECYTKNTPYPPSAEYTEFLTALKEGLNNERN